MLRASLKQYEAFYWVAQLGGFREAADFLNTTQPAISLRIKKFEGLLGVKLFEREDRPAVLTPKGHELLPLAERLLNLADQFERSAIDPAHLTGLLRIGVAESIVNTWLAEFMAAIRQAYPRIGGRYHGRCLGESQCGSDRPQARSLLPARPGHPITG